VSDPIPTGQPGPLEPVRAGEETRIGTWTGRLILFLRVMAGLSMLQGLYHWGEVTGIIDHADVGFEMRSTAWQATTIYFAVIDLVAAVGLWLAAAWGAVVWLTAVVSLAAVEVLFPQVYGGRTLVVLVQVGLLAAYLALALLAARERPP
jgi:hypothetical protein